VTGGRTSRLPRSLHPGAWWLWAIGLAAATTQTTNPLVLVLLVSAAALVVLFRRGDAPWAGGFKAYAVLALVIIATRVVFRVLLDGQHGAHVLFTLPEIPLPEAAAGIRIGGPVTAEGLLAALYDGLRLAALLLCVGAANVLADPKRLLRSTPAALHEVSVAVVVSLTLAPQLVESGRRVHRARKLRGGSARRMGLVHRVLIPVLTDALDRSLLLAAAMDSRGFGRQAAVAARDRALTGLLLLVGLVGIAVGAYGLLDASAPLAFKAPMLAVGLAAAVAGLIRSGRRIERTRFRREPWRWEETAVVASGLAVAALFILVGSRSQAVLGVPSPIVSWPTLPLVGVLGAAVALAPAVLAPPVRWTAER